LNKPIYYFIPSDFVIEDTKDQIPPQLKNFLFTQKYFQTMIYIKLLL